MNSADLCMALMRADTEAEVLKLLQTAGYWDPRLWRPIGDNENNFATIGNQQSEAIAALVEKVVNGVDARLINSCLALGIDPTGNGAPKTLREAVARFFEAKATPSDRDGHIGNWTDTQATDEGRRLTVAATGLKPDKGNPSISIADEGEGQTPDDFPNTFMSLGRSNKLRIPFVQGKFNMGGTGALQFCGGDHKFQLVVSRRNPSLLPAGANSRDHEWGFTVVRREIPTGGVRSSVFTYLAPVDVADDRRGNVLSFAADEWPIFPEADARVRDAYERAARHGSLVKLYEYDWQGTKSNIVSSGDGLLRRIDLGLPELALPVRLFECRSAYRGHSGSFATNALGLVARLDRDRGANLEPESPVGGVIALGGKQIRLRVYVFQPEKAKQYRNARHGVVFTVNGQMHGAFTIDFFRRKSVRMGYLADSLLVVADCTAIDGQMREDLFMNSRDRLRDRSLARQLEAALENFLSREPTLRALQNRRREAAIQERLQDDQPLADVLQTLLKSNPTLSKLLLQGLKLSAPFPPAGIGNGVASEFQGKPFPTYFRFKNKRDGDVLERDAHLRSRVRVAFETDAEDEYFVRDRDPGAWNVRRVTADGYADAAEWTTTGPKSGIAQLWIESLPEGVVSGDKVAYVVEVTDPDRFDAFTNTLVLTVKDGPAPAGTGDGGRDRSRNTGAGGTGGGASLTLPRIIPVRRDDWGQRGMNEESAVKVVLASDGEVDDAEAYDFFINVDNKYLRISQKDQRSSPELLEKQFTYGMVLVGLAVLQDSRHHAWSDDGETGTDADDGRAQSVEALIEVVTRALAPVLLPILETIGDLDVEEA